jgi:hypothetical protein
LKPGAGMTGIVDQGDTGNWLDAFSCEWNSQKLTKSVSSQHRRDLCC